MKRSAFVLAGLLLATAPLSASAAGEPLIIDFEALCLRGAPSTEIIGLAKQRGYVSPPPSLLRRYMPPEFKTAELVWVAEEGRVKEVIVGQIDMPGQSMTAPVCAVANMPTTGLNMDGLTSVLGVGPPLTSSGPSIYTFEETGGRRVRVDPSNSGRVISLMAKGDLRMVMVQSDKAEDMTMIMYMTPRPL